MQLSKAEEELMNLIWQKQPVVMKDLLAAYPDPKPAATTIATLLKRMADKGFVDYTTEGRARVYRARVRKKEYFADHVQGLIRNFFDDSASQFASFFTRETNLIKSELKALKSIIDEELKKK